MIPQVNLRTRSHHCNRQMYILILHYARCNGARISRLYNRLTLGRAISTQIKWNRGRCIDIRNSIEVEVLRALTGAAYTMMHPTNKAPYLGLPEVRTALGRALAQGPLPAEKMGPQ
jgi:hypothetical protein